MLTGATAWLTLIIAAITAAGLIWRKVVIPVRGFMRRLKAWMGRLEDSISLVEKHMKTNNGSTLMDKANAATQAAETAFAAADAAASAARQNAENLATLDRKITLLLAHDRERDQPGRRYGQDQHIEGDTQ